jgi:hypothetical protein
MAFLHGDPDQIPVGKSEKKDEAREKLKLFREKVQTAKHVKYWTSAEHLAGQVALSYAHFLNAYPSPGWIRADNAAGPEAIAELNALRKQNFELQAQLQIANASAPKGTENLAQAEAEYSLLINASFRLSGPNLTVNTSQRYGFTLPVTWDDMLITVGSRLLDECAETELRATLAAGLITMYEGDMDDTVQAWFKEQSIDGSKWIIRDYRGTISDESFGTILVQLIALGLVVKSSRPRSVNDRSTYWTLTPYGQGRVIQLMAIHADA